MNENDEEKQVAILQEVQSKEVDKLHTRGNGNRRLIIAIFLSLLFPGIGQLYNGQIKKGIIFITIPFLLYALNLASFVILFTAIIFVGYYLFEFFAAIFMIFWIYTIIDVIVNLILINKGKIIVKNNLILKKINYKIICFVLAIIWWYYFINFFLNIK